MAAGGRIRLALALYALMAATAVPGGAQTAALGTGDSTDPSLLQSIESQTPAVVDAGAFYVAVEKASATKVWMQQDAFVWSWPRYQAVRDALRQELSQAFDLGSATVEQLRAEAARLRDAFWLDEVCLSPQGYRQAYQARVLLETGLAREPGNLALQDDLVETIQATHPLDCYDPDVKDRVGNREVVAELRALRTQAYAQTKAEVQAGRAFTWEDFARVCDFVALWSALDPPKAIEAFDWALSQAGQTPDSSDTPYYLKKVSRVLSLGRGAVFHVYERTRGNYPHDYLYARRLPSFRGPDPEGRGLKPVLKIVPPAAPAGNS